MSIVRRDILISPFGYFTTSISREWHVLNHFPQEDSYNRSINQMLTDQDYEEYIEENFLGESLRK